LKGSAQQQVYQTPQYQNLINTFFGNIPLPTGVDESQVISRDANAVTYRDAEGYQHTLSRDLSGISPTLGQVKETGTNRPALLPLSQSSNAGAAPTQDVQQQLTNQLTQTFQNPVALQQLDPATQAALKQIQDAQNAQLQDQFNKAQGTSVAQLVGRGVGSSSIAGQIMNQLLQGQGLVQQQANSDAASRQLGVQQYLTGANQTQNQNLQQYLNSLLQIGTQRDISGAQLGLQQQQMSQQDQQFYAQLQQQILQFQEQQREAQRQNLLNNIFKGVAVATGTGAALGSAFSSQNPGGTVPSPQQPPNSIFNPPYTPNYPNPNLEGF